MDIENQKQLKAASQRYVEAMERLDEAVRKKEEAQNEANHADTERRNARIELSRYVGANRKRLVVAIGKDRTLTVAFDERCEDSVVTTIDNVILG